MLEGLVSGSEHGAILFFQWFPSTTTTGAHSKKHEARIQQANTEMITVLNGTRKKQYWERDLGCFALRCGSLQMPLFTGEAKKKHHPWGFTPLFGLPFSGWFNVTPKSQNAMFEAPSNCNTFIRADPRRAEKKESRGSVCQEPPSAPRGDERLGALGSPAASAPQSPPRPRTPGNPKRPLFRELGTFCVG